MLLERFEEPVAHVAHLALPAVVEEELEVDDALFGQLVDLEAARRFSPFSLLAPEGGVDALDQQVS